MYSDFSFCPWLGRGLPALLKGLCGGRQHPAGRGPVWAG